MQNCRGEQHQNIIMRNGEQNKETKTHTHTYLVIGSGDGWDDVDEFVNIVVNML